MSKIRILHLSDPHFGTVKAPVENALIKIVKDLSPDLIIISGDITQRARADQFKLAREFKEKLLPAHVIAIPGNHDIPLFNIFSRLLFPYRGFQKIFNHRLEEKWQKQDIEVVMLNSTSRFRHVQGALSLTQLRNAFPSSSSSIRIVGFHHPLDCAKHVDDKNLLRNRDTAMQAFAELKIDLVLGGHIHDPYVALSSDRYPHNKAPNIIAVAGTCLSWRTRANAPNSFNQIDITTDPAAEIEVTRFDLNSEFEFTEKESKTFQRTPTGAWT